MTEEIGRHGEPLWRHEKDELGIRTRTDLLERDTARDHHDVRAGPLRVRIADEAAVHPYHDLAGVDRRAVRPAEEGLGISHQRDTLAFDEIEEAIEAAALQGIPEQVPVLKPEPDLPGHASE